jgi:DNA-binding transcriptional LysR family regulator
MHYTQPAVSQQIKILEQELGAPVLVRRPRGVELTPLGRRLLVHIDIVADELRAIEELSRSVREGASRDVAVAGFRGFAETLLPTVLQLASTADGPSPRIRHVEAETPELIDQVRRGKADVAIVEAWPGQSLGFDELDAVRGGAVRYSVAVPARHRLAGRIRPTDLADFKDDLWLTNGISQTNALIGACRRHGFSPQIRCSNADAVLAMSLVARDMGVTLQMSESDRRPSDEVGVVSLTDDICSELWVVKSRFSTRPAVAAAFTAVMRGIAEIYGVSAESPSAV